MKVVSKLVQSGWRRGRVGQTGDRPRDRSFETSSEKRCDPRPFVERVGAARRALECRAG
jgi:hypothetical protein